jgi:acyl-CoA synthetase (AMP-forming)/AMP-acid ligase II
MFLVPAMWEALTQVPKCESYDLSELRFGVSGGAPCPITVIEFMQERGVTFQEGFGMTETAPLVSVLAAEDLPAKAGSIGRVAMHVDARIVDEQDRDMPAGLVGELVLQGPNIFKGYWGLPAASAEAFRNGWFHTGDLGRMDAEGFITLVDRKKDLIITGGENVYPIEVEQVLFRHPQIADVAVIGAPDERWGETVVAVVVPKPGESPTERDVIEYARGRIAHFKAPSRVEFVSELPRNATGKILKRDLRLKFSGRAESLGR